MSGIVTWSEWRALQPGRILSPGVLAEVLDGGQAFRWTGEPDGSWFGIWAGHAARVRLNPRSNLEWSAPTGLAPVAGPALARYFASDTDATLLADRLPWRSDAHLARCIQAFPGLRILRQPFGETLLCFLCSAAKQIVQIKQMAAQLAERHGAPLLARAALGPRSASGFRRLPSWPELAAATEPALRDCRLGFRARHIHRTAQFLAGHPGWLEETEQLPYAEAKLRLCALPGVGEKIADCVLLFGAGRLEAFPVDVWVIRAISRRYGLDGWKPAHIAQFGRTHFGPLAGLAQQYLFAWERKNR